MMSEHGEPKAYIHGKVYYMYVSNDVKLSLIMC